MARPVAQDHDQKADDIMNCAQSLFYGRGYRNTSIRMIIDAAGISKGTFYHYFRSREELLNRLIVRLAESIMETIRPVADDPDMDALAKFNRYFIDAGNYKLEKKEAVIFAARVMYRDENIILKEKLIRSYLEKSEVFLARIIRQGIEEGCFHTEYPDYIPKMITYMMLSIRDEFAERINSGEVTGHDIDTMYQRCCCLQESTERILGAPKGSIRIFSRELIDRFFS